MLKKRWKMYERVLENYNMKLVKIFLACLLASTLMGAANAKTVNPAFSALATHTITKYKMGESISNDCILVFNFSHQAVEVDARFDNGNHDNAVLDPMGSQSATVLIIKVRPNEEIQMEITADDGTLIFHGYVAGGHMVSIDDSYYKALPSDAGIQPTVSIN